MTITHLIISLARRTSLVAIAWLGAAFAADKLLEKPTNWAAYPVTRSISIHDLHATMLYLFGLDHERLTHRFQGRDFRLTDVHGKVVQEILA
jgi:Protein of unknown function (DUF1501)